MTSRKLLMYLEGLLYDSRSSEGWFAKTVRRDWQEIEVDRARQAEREARAVNTAQLTSRPLEMSDIQPLDWVQPD